MIRSLNILGAELSKRLKQGAKLKYLNHYLVAYSGTDWQRFDYSSLQPYTRKIVYNDDILEVVIICWNPHEESGAHDHPENGCLMRVMQGNLIETKYVNTHLGLEQTNEDILGEDKIAYQEGAKCVHNIVNPFDNLAISVHIYAPAGYKPNFFE